MTDGRSETPLQRADRNWDELLGELRVTQTGVAILSSVLLTLGAVLLLVTDVVLDRSTALVLSAVFTVGTAALWAVPAALTHRG